MMTPTKGKEMGKKHRHRYKKIEGTVGILHRNLEVCKCGKVKP